MQPSRTFRADFASLGTDLAHLPFIMKSAAPPPASDRPRSTLPNWVLVPLGLLLLLLSIGCSREKLAAILPDSMNPMQPATPLRDVLPGRWDIHCHNGMHMTIHFGHHSEMSVVLDVPAEYRERIKVDQLWFGGNYQVVSDRCVNVTMTDGRWSALLAGIKGLKLDQVGVASYTNDEVLDAEHDTWKRIGTEKAATGEVRDLADPALAENRAAVPPPSGTAPAATAKSADTSRLQKERERLARVFVKLEARRRVLDPKNAKMLAAFNKDAADYARQTERLSAQVKESGPRGPVAVEGVVSGNPTGGNAATPAANLTANAR